MLTNGFRALGPSMLHHYVIITAIQKKKKGQPRGVTPFEPTQRPTTQAGGES